MKNTSQWPRYWQQLAVMIDAGVTIESALKSLDKKTLQKEKLSKALRRTIGLVQRGQTLSQSFKQAKCINSNDYAILSIAEESGKLSQGLETIAKRRIEWHTRVESFKAGLLLPKALLVLGAFAGIFVQTATSEVPFIEVAIRVLFTLLISWVTILASVRLIQVDSLVWLSLGWPIAIIRKRWKVYSLAYENVFYRTLIWQISAGIAPDKALLVCGGLLKSKKFKEMVTLSSKSVSQGRNMANALIENNLVLGASLQRVLITSMSIGNWDIAVSKHLDLQQKKLALKMDDFFKWLPKLYYLFALLIISRFLFL